MLCNRKTFSMCIAACTLFQVPGCSLEETNGFQTVSIVFIRGGRYRTTRLFSTLPRTRWAPRSELCSLETRFAPGGGSSFLWKSATCLAPWNHQVACNTGLKRGKGVYNVTELGGVEQEFRDEEETGNVWRSKFPSLQSWLLPFQVGFLPLLSNSFSAPPLIRFQHAQSIRGFIPQKEMRKSRNTKRLL